MAGRVYAIQPTWPVERQDQRQVQHPKRESNRSLTLFLERQQYPRASKKESHVLKSVIREEIEEPVDCSAESEQAAQAKQSSEDKCSLDQESGYDTVDMFH